MHLAAKSAGSVEYTACISAEGYDLFLNECYEYVIKPSPALEIWGIWSTPPLLLSPWSTDPEW